jgi:serine/threonine protein kinase/Tol biopolymer transport system component
MPLSPGTRLGSYEIASLLGAGGMGEVYRARDLRLQREIALKVLPEIAASDPDRRERFTREALAVAALNHPHIVTIHSVEDAGSTVFLTMELVSGRALSTVLQPGGLPLERVLTIGIAVAEAISAAHQKGITHRDLKPANVMLGEGEHAGRIKVLDFGLAKIVERQPGFSPASMLPTEERAGTAEGRILGTVAYMSPEQAEGRAVDGRSDLFSLGVVLYEIATGQQPFAGETSLSILSSILKDTPRSVTEINPALPADFGRIIRRALAKDPERRYQSAKDLRNDLQDLKASLDSGELAPPSSASQVPAPLAASDRSAPAAVPAPSSDAQVAVALVRKHSRALAAAAIVLALAAAAVVFVLDRRNPEPSSESSKAVSSLADLQVTQLTTSGNAERAAISPDGRYVAYVQHDGDGDSLWIRQATTTSNVQIVRPEPGMALFGATFTPDGTSVDFVRQAADARSAPADVWRVPFLGGTPKLFVANVASPISWSPDGQRIAFLRTEFTPILASKLILANADGGQERTLATDTPVLWASLSAPWRPSFAPAWSPDGRLIAVLGARLPSTGVAVFVDSQTGSAHEVPTLGSVPYGLDWLDGQSLVLNVQSQPGGSAQLYRLPYPGGQQSRLTNDPNDYIGVSVSGDSRALVTSRRDARLDLWVGGAEGATGTDLVRRAPVGIERLAWSGDQLLYGSVVGGRYAILRANAGQGTPEAVVLDAMSFAVTSDERTIVFVSTTANILELWKADASGRRIEKLVSSATGSQVAITPDDRSVLYGSIAAGGTVSIYSVPIEGGTPAKLADGSSVAVSPDGSSMAFTDSRASLVVCALPGCTSARTIGSAQFDAAVSWTPDGRGVAYSSEGNVWVQPIAGGSPRQLTRFTDKRPIGSLAWSRDGKRLALTRSTITNDIVLFSGLK